MRLPKVDTAVVPDDKIAGYLLDADHPAGRHKARFFRSLGFSRSEPETLRAALLKHARNYPVGSCLATQFGLKFLVDGEMHGPGGRSAIMRSVWILDANTEHPRLVTAYPVRRIDHDHS
jgi:hypothetical protein